MTRFLLMIPLLWSAPAMADAAGCAADIRALGTGFIGAVLSDAFPAAAGAVRPAPTFEDGRCVLRGVSLPFDGTSTLRQTAHAERVAWTARWADESRPFPPTALTLDVSGLRHTIDFEDTDPAVAYQMQLVSETASATAALDYAYDPAAQRLDIRNASIESAGNRARISANLERFRFGAFLAPQPAIPELLAIRLTRMELHLANQGIFESLASLWLALIYPQLGETPASAVTAAKTAALAQIAAIPETLSPPATRTALAALIESLPHPSGELRLTMAAPDGLSAGDIAPTLANDRATWADFAQPLAGTRVEAEWTPRPSE